METLPQLFNYAVEQYRNQPVLIEPSEDNSLSVLSYYQVRERVHQFAGYLQGQEVQKGERILIWSASRADWLIAYFAAVLLGLVVVPVDVNSKEDFIARLIEKTEARFLITTRKQHATLQHISLPFIDIDQLPQGSFMADRLPAISKDDLAQLVFTSGTTGQPKGVMLSHSNIVSNAKASVEAVDIRRGDRALSILPLSHMLELTIDVAIFHIGACVIYARTLSPDTLFKLFTSQRITCMVLVPQALQLFMNGIDREVRRQKKEKIWERLHTIAARLPFSLRRYLFGTIHQKLGGHFRFFVSGGAYLPPVLGRRWENMGVRVLQGYGTTECSPVVSVNRTHDHNMESTGLPLPGVEVRIAPDKEILVRGPNVTLGYWHNEDATKAAFDGEWYRTGDLGLLDAKGGLYIKGRKKNLIVLANGMNVFPEDLENILLENKNLKDAVVMGLGRDEHDPQVHAILLMEHPDQATAKAAIQQANKRLAAHQQIRGFTIWPEEDFPRTHTLKVKRQDMLATLTSLRKEQEIS
ncbi:AMP-dependent synthetase/ligase [Ktedonospora formicarum]|uniref:AMP-dependent synthetase/ligase domain-containing protein n=1 Tax=Ktedonospora formicarum TaxID=2778364 RepID=A0A8J3HU42_9CHLR|nr:AMP-binding protein [Ktedonospora formicarum]GHO43769.1 hypothetical protein KSX_19320 [Ktedonospora formicarum]